MKYYSVEEKLPEKENEEVIAVVKHDLPCGVYYHHCIVNWTRYGFNTFDSPSCRDGMENVVAWAYLEKYTGNEEKTSNT